MAQPISVVTTHILPSGDTTDDTESIMIIGISIAVAAGIAAIVVLTFSLSYYCYMKLTSSTRVRSKNAKSAVKKEAGEVEQQQMSTTCNQDPRVV